MEKSFYTVATHGKFIVFPFSTAAKNFTLDEEVNKPKYVLLFILFCFTLGFVDIYRSFCHCALSCNFNGVFFSLVHLFDVFSVNNKTVLTVLLERNDV